MRPSRLPWLRGALLLVPSALAAWFFLSQTPEGLHCWGRHGVLVTEDDGRVHERPDGVFGEEFFRIHRVPPRARLVTTDPFALNGVIWRDRTDPVHVFVLAIDGRPDAVIHVTRGNGGYRLAGEFFC